MANGHLGAAVLAHSGGPTAVINASLLGLVEEARRVHPATRIYGSRFGLDGILKRDFVDLSALAESRLAALGQAPSSALGTSRREFTGEDTERLIEAFDSLDAHCLFYTGGNGSMGAALRISRLARDAGYDLQVVGIPKTIDNDLAATDHTPGYASAARFFALAARDIGADNRALAGQVEFLEVLGRNVGWIVAATALARRRPDDAPHLIYLPERRLPVARLMEDVDRVYRRLGRCMVAVCEGQLDENGDPFGADVRGGSRGQLAMNVGHRMALLTARHLGLKARAEKPGLLGRVNAAARSGVDWAEARLCGQAAFRAAAAGETGVMVALEREAGAGYRVTTGLAPLEAVAGAERPFPAEWRNEPGNDVATAFLDYAAPLVGEIAGFETLG